MPKSSFQKNSRDSIWPITKIGSDKVVFTFSKCISQKVNVIAWREFELVYCDVTVWHVNNYAMGIPFLIFFSLYIWVQFLEIALSTRGVGV